MAAEQAINSGPMAGKSPRPAPEADAQARAALRFALRRARKSLRWLAVWPALARGLAVGAVCAAAWIVLIRFTLADLPGWPAVVLYSAGLATSLWWAFSRRVSASRAARFLDAQLSLDERVSTLLELQRAGRASGKQDRVLPILPGMLTEASSLVLERISRLPRQTWWRARKKDAITVASALLVLGASVVLPTPLDAVRAEQAALRQALEARLAGLEALRREIAADPLITPETKAKLDTELWALQEKLRTPGIGRSELVAALADTEEKLSAISTMPVSAYDSLLRAAQMVVERATNTSFWVEDILVGETELSRAADAAGYLSRFATRFTADEDRAIALTFDQSAQVTGQTHPLFTTDFQQAAAALRAQGGADASRIIDQIARRFRQADGELRTSQALERTRSQLDESRRDVAQAGTVAKKKGQVGFRRRDAAPKQRATATALATGNAGSEGSSGAPVANTPRPAQGIAPGAGAAPGSDAPSAPAAAKAITPGATGPSGMPGQPSSGDQSSSSAGNPPGSGSPSQDGVKGPSQSAPGQGGEGDSAGTLQGPVTGPVGGTSGAISRVPNPEGSGTGGSPQSTEDSSGEGSSDTVSIPKPSSTDPSGTGGSPGDDVSPQGKVGGQTTGASGDTQQRSGGALTGIKTPYKEVIGEYADRASKALERTYIPSDAKEYVKQYFTLLGR